MRSAIHGENPHSADRPRARPAFRVVTVISWGRNRGDSGANSGRSRGDAHKCRVTTPRASSPGGIPAWVDPTFGGISPRPGFIYRGDGANGAWIRLRAVVPSG